jgi:hypothetical protein
MKVLRYRWSSLISLRKFTPALIVAAEILCFLPPVLAKADLEVLQFLQMSKKKQITQLMSENGSYI